MTGKTFERCMHLFHNATGSIWATVDESSLNQKALDELVSLGVLDVANCCGVTKYALAQRTTTSAVNGVTYIKPFPLTSNSAPYRKPGCKVARICRTDRTRLEWVS